MSNLLTVSQVAEKTTLSKATIYKYVAEKKIPFIKIGTRLVFDPQKINAWIEARQVTPGNDQFSNV